MEKCFLSTHHPSIHPFLTVQSTESVGSQQTQYLLNELATMMVSWHQGESYGSKQGNAKNNLKAFLLKSQTFCWDFLWRIWRGACYPTLGEPAPKLLPWSKPQNSLKLLLNIINIPMLQLPIN